MLGYQQKFSAEKIECKDSADSCNCLISARGNLKFE